MYQHLTDWETHAENMQISVCFCKTCICLKNLENIQISVNMINRLDITDEYSVKCDFILNTVTFIDAALNISLRKLWKCNVLWFYLFGQGVPNETKGTINLKGDLIKFCEIFTKITLELPKNSQKPFFKCKKLVINTTKCDLCLFLHKMCCKMVWKFCEVWKILRELAFRWVKFHEILSLSVRYGMYDLMILFFRFVYMN